MNSYWYKKKGTSFFLLGKKDLAKLDRDSPDYNSLKLLILENNEK